METKRVPRIALAAMAVSMVFGLAPFASAQKASKETQASVTKMLDLLPKSGYQFKQYSPVVWGIDFEGKAIGTVRVVMVAQENIVVIFAIIAKKDEIPLTAAFLQTMLKCNHKFDRVKVGLDDDGDAFVRTDTSARVLDGEEFKAIVEQVAAAANEAYDLIKPSLKKVAAPGE
jgi:hypothetical protein